MRRHKTEDYQQTAAYLENIIALLPGHIYWKDRKGVLQGCNDEQAKSIGLSSRADIVGLTAYDTLPKDFADEVTRIDQEIMATGIPKTVEEVLTLPNGEKSIWLSKKTPLYDAKGTVIGILGISFDITEKKTMEEKLLQTQHKLEGMTLVSASIAHEIRTPLATLDISADMVKSELPALIESYQTAKEKALDVPLINNNTLSGLIELPNIMKREISGANAFINMLLMNVNPDIEGNANQIFSISDCIEEALARYPFKPHQQTLIRWKKTADFLVKGKQKLIVHLLFNLIKNALFYVGEGKIEINVETDNAFNKIIFVDTGTGISADSLPHIFEPFFSRTRNGAGIGLSFCKTVMETVGGDITCESVEGQYTKFIVAFPFVA